ncbi:hypothetical protein EDB86DRAFT_718535 [Lactarius hatsudake]|nr:hypothetical protein EDB86DRAFT_718535 [Lactarius hatsudake]
MPMLGQATLVLTLVPNRYVAWIFATSDRIDGTGLSGSRYYFEMALTTADLHLLQSSLWHRQQSFSFAIHIIPPPPHHSQVLTLSLRCCCTHWPFCLNSAACYFETAGPSNFGRVRLRSRPSSEWNILPLHMNVYIKSLVFTFVLPRTCSKSSSNKQSSNMACSCAESCSSCNSASCQCASTACGCSSCVNHTHTSACSH